MAPKSASITISASALLLAAAYGGQSHAFNFKQSAQQQAINQASRQAAAQAQVASSVHDKWAVVIGVSNFKDATIAPIKYGYDSAGKLGRAFLDPSAGRFRNDHMVVLQQDDADKDSIEDVLTNGLTSKALPTDLIVIYIGSRWMPNKTGDDLIFCAVETSAAKPDETGLELGKILSTIRRRTQSRNILCLLDLSPVKENSATEKLFQNAPKSKTLPPGTLGRLSALTNVNIISANDLTTSSAQTPFTETSYFARFLIEDLKGSGGAATVDTIGRMIVDQVRDTVKSEQKTTQVPEVCTVSDSLPNLSLGTVFAKPKNIATIVGFPADLKGLKFGIEAGRMPIDHPELLPGSGIGIPIATPPGQRRNVAAQNMPPRASETQSYQPNQANQPNQTSPIEKPQLLAKANLNEPEPGAKQINLAQLKARAAEKELLTGKDAKDDKDDDDDQPSKDLDLTPYIAQVKKAIQAKWQPPKGLENHKAVAVFTVMRDGTIQEPELIEPSGIAAVDRAALEALKAASPLPPLPSGSPKTVQLKYKFEWKVTRK